MTKKICFMAILFAFVMQSVSVWSATQSVTPVYLYSLHSTYSQMDKLQCASNCIGTKTSLLEILWKTASKKYGILPKLNPYSS